MQQTKPSRKIEKILSTFSHKQMKELMANVGSIQLTDGCSFGCGDCGLGAEKGVSDIIAFDTLEWLFKEYSNELKSNFIMLYDASDPFDFQDGEKTYVDVHRAFESIVGISPHVTTHIPVEKEDEIMKYFFESNTLGIINHAKFIDRISYTNMNKKRFRKALEKYVPALVNTDEQMVVKAKFSLEECSKYVTPPAEAGGFKDFHNKTRERLVLRNYNEIAETLGIAEPENFFLEWVNDQTVLKSEAIEVKYDETNSLFHYFSNNELGVNPEEERLVAERSRELTKKTRELTPRHHAMRPMADTNTEMDLHVVKLPNNDFVAYHNLPVDYTDIMQYAEFLHFDRSLSIGPPSIVDFVKKTTTKGVHTKKLGLDNVNNFSPNGIGCFHGVTLTPKGFFNVNLEKPSPEHPYCQRRTLITPDNFKVVEYKYEPPKT